MRVRGWGVRDQVRDGGVMGKVNEERRNWDRERERSL